ncbi:anthranilate synthase component I family protein [bacterium]
MQKNIRKLFKIMKPKITIKKTNEKIKLLEDKVFCLFERPLYKVLGTDPYLILESKNNLKKTLDKYKINIKSKILKKYDFKPGACIVLGYDGSALLIFPSKYILEDAKTKQRYEMKIDIRKRAEIKVDSKVKKFKAQKCTSNFTKTQYCKAVDRAIEYIKSGHIYQVNLAQQFTGTTEKSFLELFKSFKKLSKTQYVSLINMVNYQIISCTPERFLKRTNNTVITEPIKGTSPRAKDKRKDMDILKNLLYSEKEQKELAMIVDLARNDLNKTAIPGSVKVKEFKRVDVYPNVYHLAAKIEAEVNGSQHSLDIIDKAFPPASVTGCPKSRALEIIAELEKMKRGIYCGAIGWYGFDGDFDLSMAIRTIVTIPGANCTKYYYSAGSGIVFGSEPDKEYEETLHKASPFLGVI